MDQKTTTHFAATSAEAAPNCVDVQVGSRVRKLRMSRGIGLHALAEMIGATSTEMQDYEIGERRISAALLLRIALALNMPASHFFESRHTPPRP